MSETSLDEIKARRSSGDSETDTTTEIPAPFGVDEGRRVGHVTAQDEPIVVDREESCVRVFVDSDTRESVRLGDYLRVPYPAGPGADHSTAMLVGVIARLEYETVADITDKRDGGYHNPPGEQSFAYVARIDPISTVEFDPDDATDADDANDADELLRQATVDKPPKPGANAYLVENEGFLRTALRIPHEGAFVGHMAVSGDRIPSEDEPLPYYLFNPNATDENEDAGEPTVFRHLQVAGSTGQGKTHASKNVLRQLATEKRYTIEVPPEEREAATTDIQDERVRGLNATVIDPEGEYVEMGDDPDNDGYGQALRDELDGQGIRHGGIGDDPNVDFETFVPYIEDTNIDHNDAEAFGIPFELVRTNRQLLYSSKPPERTRSAINDVISRYFRQEKGTPTYDAFSTYAETMLADDNDAITEMDSVKIAARERIVDKYEYNRIFDHGTQSLTDLTQRMFAPSQVTVIPTDHLRGQTDRIVVSCLLAHIVGNKVGSNVDYPHIKGTPLLLALDEAHEYLTGGGDDPRENYLVRNFQQAAKRGRKDKFGLYIITQTPQDINDDVRKQMNTRIYLGLERDVVDSHDVYVPDEFEDAVTQFNKGQMVVKQPNVRPVEIAGLPVCLTRHTN